MLLLLAVNIGLCYEGKSLRLNRASEWSDTVVGPRQADRLMAVEKSAYLRAGDIGCVPKVFIRSLGRDCRDHSD